MKHLFSTFMFIVVALTTTAQNKFGIATYTVPAGWQLTEQRSSVIIERKTDNGVCIIKMFATDMPYAVLSTADYTRYRSKTGLEQVTYNDTKGSITKSEANGMTSFSSYGSGTVKGVPIRNSFYSFTNGSQTFFVQLTATDNDCIMAFNTFLDNLLIDPVEEKSSGTTNAKKTTTRGRKAAPAAVPAAPAPMM